MTIIGPALLRLGCAALLGALVAQASPARSDEAPLATPHGLLEARDSESEEECAPDDEHPCEVIVLAGKVLFANRLARIEAALPSREAPRLVSVRLHDGGNCCPGTDMLLDFTGPRVRAGGGWSVRACGCARRDCAAWTGSRRAALGMRPLRGLGCRLRRPMALRCAP